MPHFCEKCGADTYICQTCHKVFCSNETEGYWRTDITGNKAAGTVCETCQAKFDWNKASAKERREKFRMGTVPMLYSIFEELSERERRMVINASRIVNSLKS